MKVLERAIVMPAEQDWVAKDRSYPKSGDYLMVNPFPKPKKKGKKKKGKKK